MSVAALLHRYAFRGQTPRASLPAASDIRARHCVPDTDTNTTAPPAFFAHSSLLFANCYLLFVICSPFLMWHLIVFSPCVKFFLHIECKKSLSNGGIHVYRNDDAL